jgi:hypothetical protein
MSLSTNDITKTALTELYFRNCIVWRQNQVNVRGRAFIGKKGLSDIQGFHSRTGIAVYCEVKAKGDKLSDDQKEFLAAAANAGCITLIATEIKNRFAFISFKNYLVNELIEMDLNDLSTCKNEVLCKEVAKK